MEPIVGIDLGTTNSAIAVLVDGKPVVIEVDGQPTMPSCVGIDAAGKLMVGQAARNQVVASPESTVLSIKRQMGKDVIITLGDRRFSPQEISALILARLKEAAEAHLGQRVEKAVVTVPAYFNDSQRKATQDAGVLAGLEVVRIINEPTAAAMAYDAAHTQNERMLVYDLGGGTFDASLVVVENGVVEVKASHGDTQLGGDDFDMELVKFVAADFRERHGVDLTQDLRAQRRLKISLEKAKWVLSDEPFVHVLEEYVHGGEHIEMEIPRDVYEDMIHPYIVRTLDCLHQCLRDAGMLPRDIDKVMLVGGSTRTPLVYRALKDALHIAPRFEIDPELIVAMGAAIQGGIIAGMETHSVLVDITPYTFGTAAVADYEGDLRADVFVPVIHRNLPLPVSKSEMFYTMFDGQERVEVRIYQGEQPLADDNTFVGKFMVEGLCEVPAGNQILLSLELDMNGMLHVTATEKQTGLARRVTMDTKNVRNNFDMTTARENIASLLGQAAAAAETGQAAALSGDSAGDLLITQAKGLRQRAESLLETAIDAEDVEEIKDLLARSRQAIADCDWDTLSQCNESVSDMIFYLED